MSRSNKGPARYWLAAGFLVSLCVLVGESVRSQDANSGYWLRFGKTMDLCPGAIDSVPEKIEGASWGILASGVVLCEDRGDAYVLTLDYLNVAIDPTERYLIKRDVVAFDWLGLALYRPSSNGVDWLFDESRPLKGDLRRDATGRIVFGKLSYKVPKSQATKATNMLFYLTFDGPLVAIHVL